MRLGLWLQFVLLLWMATATGYAQTYPKSAVCHGDMLVGEIPNSPLTADIVVQKRSVLKDGSLGPLFYSRHVGFVARDSHGKVAVRMTEAPDDPKWKPGQKDPEGWHEWICDPQTKTMTHLIQFSRYSAHFASTAPQEQVIHNVHDAGTEIFEWWRYPVAGRENLGEETFENLPAHRYRVNKAYPPRSYEYVTADGLALELLHSIWYSDPAIAVETRLTNLRFSEPLKKLMAVPAWGWSQTDPMPSSIAPPGMMLGLPQSPFPNP